MNIEIESKDYHLVNGVYYCKVSDGSASVFRVESNLLRVELQETITLPNGEILNVETIGSAFSNSNIESIVIPKSVKRLYPTAFEGCANLIDVKFCGDIECIGDSCFSFCTRLESIVLPNNVGRIGCRCFSYCSSLKKIKLPLNITCIADSMFAHCRSLTYIELPPLLTSIKYKSFEGCSELTNICFHENITCIGVEAFAHCTALKSIEIKNPNLSIGYKSFYHCTSLETIKLPSQDYIMEKSCFIDCINLKTPNVFHQSDNSDYSKAKRKNEQKEEKYRKLRETMWYLLGLIGEVFEYVLIVLLIVATFIAGEKLGIVAKIVIFVLQSWIMIVLIKSAMMRNSGEICINDFFKTPILVFVFIEFVLLVIYHILKFIISGL